MEPSLPHHHKKTRICATRPAYRDPRKDRAVKVYTVNQESQYILIQGVPKIHVIDELIELCALYGTVAQYDMVVDIPDIEPFTEVVKLKYSTIQYARVGKRKLDDKGFYGSVLHVSYAPEYETLDEIREKFSERKRNVARRRQQLARERGGGSNIKSPDPIQPSNTTQGHQKWSSSGHQQVSPSTNHSCNNKPPQSSYPVNNVTAPCISNNNIRNRTRTDYSDINDGTWTRTPVVVATIDLQPDVVEQFNHGGGCVRSSRCRYESVIVAQDGAHIYKSQLHPTQRVDQSHRIEKERSIGTVLIRQAPIRPQPSFKLNESRGGSTTPSPKFVPRQIVKRKLDEQQNQEKSLKMDRQPQTTDNRLII